MKFHENWSQHSMNHCLLKISMLCCCHLLFVNIITKVLWKLYITGPYYAYSVSHKNHSCPIISAMAVCICMASAVHCWQTCSISVLELSTQFLWRSGNVSDCKVNYLCSNPGWFRHFYNNWKQIKLRNFTAMISRHERKLPLRNYWFVVPNPPLIRK